jgi:hypothetical protein
MHSPCETSATRHSVIHMLDVQRHLDRIGAKYPVIREHWKAFASTAIVCAAASWGAANYFYSGRLADSAAHISLLQDQVSNAQHAQAALSSIPPSQWRRLTDDQRAKLLNLLSKPENKFANLVIYAMADSEPRQYGAQFVDIFRSSGTLVFPREVPLNIMADIGLMVGVGDVGSPTAEAKRFADLLQQAGISTHYTAWQRDGNSDKVPVDFDLYVGPKPW